MRIWEFITGNDYEVWEKKHSGNKYNFAGKMKAIRNLENKGIGNKKEPKRRLRIRLINALKINPTVPAAIKEQSYTFLAHAWLINVYPKTDTCTFCLSPSCVLSHLVRMERDYCEMRECEIVDSSQDVLPRLFDPRNRRGMKLNAFSELRKAREQPKWQRCALYLLWVEHERAETTRKDRFSPEKS